MRIVQLLPELNEGGVERGTVELSREFVKLSHESYVISNGGKLVSQLENEGAKHIQFDVCSKNPFTAIFRIIGLRKILKKLQPDIIHARSRVPAWLTYFANKSLHIPFVTTVHGLNSVNKYSEIMTRGDKVICVSSAVKEHICKNYSFDCSKIAIIPRGIDLEKFNPNNIDKLFIEDFKVQYNLQDKFIVSSVGRITQLKDYETFIKAFLLIKKQIPNVVGLIVGGAREDKKEYLKSLKDLADENIIFTGSISKIAEIYALSDVVVSSSKKPESFGRAVAEALAMNTPVVATNHGGVKDIIQDGVNGYFFEVGDVLELGEKIVKAKELQFDGYGYISSTFSLEKMVDKTLKVYGECV